ncbi:MAG: hypothetical protein HY512_02385 [Candidatus Aenigmarchaeota archaeon]|nr:hypothetical protein [Candidatus Aenigmarchaeota archaeon]
MSRGRERGERIANWFNDSAYAYGFFTGVLLSAGAGELSKGNYWSAATSGIVSAALTTYSYYRWRRKETNSAPETLREHNEVR